MSSPASSLSLKKLSVTEAVENVPPDAVRMLIPLPRLSVKRFPEIPIRLIAPLSMLN